MRKACLLGGGVLAVLNSLAVACSPVRAGVGGQTGYSTARAVPSPHLTEHISACFVHVSC